MTDNMELSCHEHYGTLNTTVEKVIYALINVVVIFVASFLNITVISIIKTRAVLHQPSFILIAALACSDLSMVMVSGTIYAAVILSGGTSNCGLEIATCCLTSTIAANSILLLCCITHDRYQCIKNSRTSRPYTTKKKAFIKIVSCISTSMIFSLVFYIETIHKLPFRAVEILSALMFSCFVYIIIYYIKLVKIVKANKVIILPGGPQNPTADSRRQIPSYLFNLNRSIFMLILSYAVAYFPVTIIFMIQIVLHRMNIPPNHTATAFIWCTTFGYLNALLDPLIYAYRSDAIGRELRKVIF